jgi:Fic family protein
VTEPATPLYQPFPPFAEWAGVAVDEQTFDGYASVLDDLRAGSDSDSLTRAVEVATRVAAIDTGAIEGLYEVDRGFTMTVARGVAAWEKVIAAREPVVRRSFEDALRAYDFVLDLATTRTEVSEKAIREIHQLICAGQETYRVVTSAGWQERALPKGEYKDTPNNPTSRRTGEIHAYAPPMDVPIEMRRMVEELRSGAFAAAHPVLQAAYAHYSFVAVHPFADGNGRVARALASVYLYRRPGVPLVIFADQKDAYLDGLEDADEGRPERFVRFVQERVVDVIGLVQVSAQSANDRASAGLASLREALTEWDAGGDREIDAMARRLLTAAAGELKRQAAALELPPEVATRDLDSRHRRIGVEGEYRMALGTEYAVGVSLVATDLGLAAYQEIGVRVRRHDSAGPRFQLVAIDGPGRLGVELREVFPEFTAVLGLKIEIWVGGLVGQLLSRLGERIREAAARNR